MRRNRRYRYVRLVIPVVSPYMDRLQAAAFDPCWRTSEEGREFQRRLTEVLNG